MQDAGRNSLIKQNVYTHHAKRYSVTKLPAHLLGGEQGACSKASCFASRDDLRASRAGAVLQGGSLHASEASVYIDRKPVHGLLRAGLPAVPSCQTASAELARKLCLGQACMTLYSSLTALDNHSSCQYLYTRST